MTDKPPAVIADRAEDFALRCADVMDYLTGDLTTEPARAGLSVPADTDFIYTHVQ